eukprot:scaffold497_cov368-Prasinococcus_capsulatus_cf.AAC.22
MVVSRLSSHALQLKVLQTEVEQPAHIPTMSIAAVSRVDEAAAPPAHQGANHRQCTASRRPQGRTRT